MFMLEREKEQGRGIEFTRGMMSLVWTENKKTVSSDITVISVAQRLATNGCITATITWAL
mgnify:CR=1 FL=1